MIYDRRRVIAEGDNWRVVVGWGSHHGNTAYLNNAWGWTVEALGGSGWYDYIGQSCDTFRMAMREARNMASQYLADES